MEKSGLNLIWIGLLALASFLVTYILVNQMALSREWFVFGHALISGSLLTAYLVWRQLSWTELRGDVRLGLIGAAVAGVLMIGFILVGPSSRSPTGLKLVWTILWLGVVYGFVDSMLLSVFPVLACRWIGGTDLLTKRGMLRPASIIAFALSLSFAAIYHLGFPEFRSAVMGTVLLGNGIITLSYLATGSALSPVLAHVAMHIVAVTYGYASALPVPPHY